MTSFKRPPIVEVEWVDSMGYPGWRQKGEVEASCARVGELDHFTAGYLLVSKRDYVTVALSVGRIGSTGDAIQIPRRAIKRVTVIRKLATPESEAT